MRYVDKSEQALDEIERKLVPRLARVGFAAEGRAKRGTPVLTGNARRSLHTVVIGEDGRRLDGPPSDENGNHVPDYPANGTIRVIVGSNCGYYKFIEFRRGALAGALAETRAYAMNQLNGMV